MNDAQKAKIDAWSRDKSQEDDDIPGPELQLLNSYARDRYTFDRGLHLHALEPVWSFGVVMARIADYTSADTEVLEGFIRSEVDRGDDKAEDFLDHI